MTTSSVSVEQALVPNAQLLVLGNASVLDAGGASTPLPMKAVALLAYLRLTATRRAHRAFLADLLWSEVTEEKGRASLRQAVLAIRQCLGDDCLTTAGQDIQLAGRLDCDAATFITHATEGQYTAAVDAYHGDFFAQFAVPGARGFELWATVERERLRGIFLRAADAAAQQALDAGRARAAVDIATRLITIDSTRERSWRLLLEARLTLGDLAGARVDAESMRAVMVAQEMTLEPATDALLARIQRIRTPEVNEPARILRAELIGRVQAFSSLLDAWRGLGTTGIAVRMVTGDAGYGKTRLLDDLTIRLRTLGGRVVRVNARYGDAGIPYALLQQVAEALVELPGAAGVAPESARTLVTLEPRLRDSLGQHDPDATLAVDLPLRRSTAVADLMSAVCDDRPIALLIDDLHWADSASQQALIAAIARNRGSRLLIVAAQRAGGTAGFAAEEVALEVLTAADVRALIESIKPLRHEPWTETIAARIAVAGRGIPLLVLETLQLLSQEGLLVQGAEYWDSPDVGALEARLQSIDVLRERLARVDAGMRAVLQQLAVAGAEVSQVLLRNATGVQEIGDVVQRLLLGGWIFVEQGTVRVRHDEILRTVLSLASEAERTAARRAMRSALDGASMESSVEWRIAARLATEDGDVIAVSALLDRWMAAMPDVRMKAGWRDAVVVLLGDQATPALLRNIAAYRPWRERFNRSALRAAAVLFVVLGAGGALAMRQQARMAPATLRFVAAPISGTSVGMMPELAVEMLNADGQRIEQSGDTIRLTMRSSSARLDGRLVAITKDGVASFSDVRLTGDPDNGAFVKAYRGAMKTPEVRLLGPSDAALHVTEVRVPERSGAVVENGVVVIGPGISVTAELNMRYTAPWAAATVMFAGVPSWGDHADNVIELGPFPTPSIDGTRFTPLTFEAPMQPGRYRIFLVMAAETDAAHIASATNWSAGPPRWNDGNDVADWGERYARAAATTGHVTLADDGWLYANRRSMNDLGVAVLNIEVRTSVVLTRTGTP